MRPPVVKLNLEETLLAEHVMSDVQDSILEAIPTQNSGMLYDSRANRADLKIQLSIEDQLRLKSILLKLRIHKARLFEKLNGVSHV